MAAGPRTVASPSARLAARLRTLALAPGRPGSDVSAQLGSQRVPVPAPAGKSWGGKSLGLSKSGSARKPGRRRAAPPHSPRLLRTGSDSPRRQARQAGPAVPSPPPGPSSSPRHTPGRNLHPSALGGRGSPSSCHPALHLPSLHTPRAHPCGCNVQPAAPHRFPRRALS